MSLQKQRATRPLRSYSFPLVTLNVARGLVATHVTHLVTRGAMLHYKCVFFQKLLLFLRLLWIFFFQPLAKIFFLEVEFERAMVLKFCPLSKWLCWGGSPPACTIMVPPPPACTSIVKLSYVFAEILKKSGKIMALHHSLLRW